MSRHENQNKKCKKLGYVYRKIRITQRSNTEDTKQRSQIRVLKVKNLHMEKDFEDRNVLFLESGAHSKSLQICIAFFTTYGGFKVCQNLEYMEKESR